MDIHNYDKRLERAIENVKKCNRIGSENRKLILRFIEFKRAQGTSTGRCAKILWTLKKFALSEYERRRQRSSQSFAIMKDFESLAKQDIQREFARLENSSLKETTKRDYKLLVRYFLGWVFHEKTGSVEPYDPREHGYPEILKRIRIKEPKETIKPSDLLSYEEKQSMIDAAKNLRDKALIACLNEAGMRPGELLSLKIGDVTINEQYGELSLNGKTGIRSSFIIRNLAYLAQWLDSYHQNNDPNAPLWQNFENPGEPLSYAGLRQMLKRVAAKARIKKRIYPYIFRHTSATNDSAELTEPVMRKLYGWSKNSKTPSYYEHLSGKDARIAKLRQAGLFVEEDEKRLRLCPRCRKPNPSDATMCHACGSVISVREAVNVREERKKLAREVEDLKSVVTSLIATQLKPGQTTDDILSLTADRKRIISELKKHGIAEEARGQRDILTEIKKHGLAR